MSPRPNDLEPENQYALASAAMDAMTPEEIRRFPYFFLGFAPGMFLTVLQAYRESVNLPDGWDMAD